VKKLILLFGHLLLFCFVFANDANYHMSGGQLIPVEETASRTKILRFLAPRSGLTQGVSFASTYEAEKILATL
jgi:hypothetical protein